MKLIRSYTPTLVGEVTHQWCANRPIGNTHNGTVGKRVDLGRAVSVGTCGEEVTSVFDTLDRAIRRCGELLKQIDPKQGANQNIHDSPDMNVLIRTTTATQAGLSERQKVTALRVAYAVRLLADYPWHIHVNG